MLSAKGRAIPSSSGTLISGALQTDVQLTSDRLGGALLDGGGRLVGIASVSYTSAAASRSSGVSFAIDADSLRAVVPSLIVYGSPSGKR